MITIEYGKENSEVILLLHGGGLSWWNYREVAEVLQTRYHVIMPILDGHAGSDKDFSSIESNAQDIIKYIDEVLNGSVTLIGGVSLGGQILVEMLSQRNDICKYAVIESTLIIPMKFTHMLVKPMMDMSFGLIKQEWFSKLQFKSLKIKKELYDDYYRDTCKITKENMISILQANASFTVRKELQDSRIKAFIFVGRKERFKMIRSGKCMNKILPNSTLTIMDQRYHGEFSLNHAVEYAGKVMEILELK